MKPAQTLLWHGVAVSFAVTMSLSTRLSAADFTWDGGGVGNNWSAANNWNPNGAPPNDGTADIIFTGGNKPLPNVDTAWTINTLTFASGTSVPFTVGGQTLTLKSDGLFPVQSPSITNSSTQSHTINNTLVFQNNGTIHANSGDLTLGGFFIDSGGNTITLTAATSRTLALNTILTGTGNFTKNGAGTATLGTSAIYSGTTTVNAGALELSGSINSSETVNVTGGTLRLLAADRIANAAAVSLS